VVKIELGSGGLTSGQEDGGGVDEKHEGEGPSIDMCTDRGWDGSAWRGSMHWQCLA
jgi:hypothetical protein